MVNVERPDEQTGVDAADLAIFAQSIIHAPLVVTGREFDTAAYGFDLDI